MSRDLTGLGLPSEILDAIEMQPVEDLALQVLRERFPSTHITSLIEFDQTGIEDDFFILVRRIPSWGNWDGDARFIDFAGLSVHVFSMSGPDSDERAALVSEAVRTAFRDAARRAAYYPGLGGLFRVRMDEEPVRKTDWATSSGPVQFADLPAGYQRYESRYSFWIRRPIWG